MSTGCNNPHGDTGNAEEQRADGPVGCVNASSAHVENGAVCTGNEAREAEGIDAVEPVDGDADCEAEPEESALYKKVMNLNRFVDEAAKGLDPISMNIWIVLFRFECAGIAWASQETIAERLGLSPKTVYRHIAILKRKKLLRVVKQGHRGGRCNTYQLGILPLEPVAKRPDRVKKPK